MGAVAGKTEWPVTENSSAAEEWGLRPVQSSQDYTGRRFQSTVPIDVVAMRDLVVNETIWDLIHIDVQGDEVAICRSCIEELNARVRWMVIGTHSRKLDGDLLELMAGGGWFRA